MKKLFLLIGFAAFSLTAAAQNEAVWGIRAGVNFANMSGKAPDVDGNKIDRNTDTRTSFSVGVAYQQPLLRKAPLYLETGLYLSGRGGKMTTKEFLNSDENIPGKTTLNMMYVQLPVMLSWHFNLRSVSLQPLVGAYYGLGVYGKAKIENVNEKLNLFKSTTIEDGKVDQIFKRSEVGLRFGLNVVVKKHYMIGASYDMGLTNIIKDKDLAKDGKMHNKCFNILLGYNF